MLNIYNYVPQTKTLGPFTRFALWTQGCPFSCEGCMTPDSQSFDGGAKVKIADIVRLISATDEIEGITISGGEPFVQAQALYKMIKELKKERDLGVIVYTGFTLKQLENKEDIFISLMLEEVDILIDGLYEDELNDNISLRGSSNQKIYQLTSRYATIFDTYYNLNKREVEVHMQENGAMLCGIPKEFRLNEL